MACLPLPKSTARHFEGCKNERRVVQRVDAERNPYPFPFPIGWGKGLYFVISIPGWRTFGPGKEWTSLPWANFSNPFGVFLCGGSGNAERVSVNEFVPPLCLAVAR